MKKSIAKIIVYVVTFWALPLVSFSDPEVNYLPIVGFTHVLVFGVWGFVLFALWAFEDNF